MTWKYAVYRVLYAGAKVGIRFAAGDRPAMLAAYKRALEPYVGIFLTGPNMGTFPADFLDGTEDPLPLWARSHEGLGMDDLATGHGVKAAAEAALAQLGRGLAGATVAIEGFGKVGARTARTHCIDLRISPWYRWRGAVPACKCHISLDSISRTYLRVRRLGYESLRARRRRRRSGP